LAVSVRTEPRLTRDADLAVLVADDRDAEALVRDLHHAEATPAIPTRKVGTCRTIGVFERGSRWTS